MHRVCVFKIMVITIIVVSSNVSFRIRVPNAFVQQQEYKPS